MVWCVIIFDFELTFCRHDKIMVIQEGLGGGHGTQRTSIRCFKRGRREEDFLSVLNSAIFLKSSGNSRGKEKGEGRFRRNFRSIHSDFAGWNTFTEVKGRQRRPLSE